MGPLGTSDTPEDFVIAHVHHVFDDYPEIRALRDLPQEWAAERDSAASHDWRRQPWLDEPE